MNKRALDSEGDYISSKRIKPLLPVLPEVKAPLSTEPDFSLFTHCKVEYDIIVSNGYKAFECHKSILSHLSPQVMRVAIEGDKNSKEIVLKDLTDEAIEGLQKIIYCNPSNRHQIFADWLFEHTGECFCDCIVLISKYGFQLLSTHLHEYVKHITFMNGNTFFKILESMQRNNLNEIAKDFKIRHISSISTITKDQMAKNYDRIGLESFGIPLICEMIRSIKDVKKSMLFLNLAGDLAVEKGSVGMRNALLQKVPSTAFHLRYRLSKISA